KGKTLHWPERLTSTTGNDMLPLYSPDGKFIAYASARSGEFGIWMLGIEGAVSSELASSRDSPLILGDWAPDGKSLVFCKPNKEGGWQLYNVAVDTKKVTQILNDSA